MNHIVIDARELRTSTGRYVERLLHYLQQIDTEHRYSVLIYPKDLDTWEPSNPNFTKISCPHKEFSFSEQIGLLDQLETLQPNLVHFSMIQQPILYRHKVVTSILDLTTARFKNPSKNPLIFWVKQQIYKIVIKIVAKKSKHIITISNFVKDDLAKFTRTPTNKMATTYLAADELSAGSESVPGVEGSQFIMYVGRPQPHKNLARLIDAFVILKETHPELKLVLAGRKDATYEMHAQRVVRENIPDVIFTDFITDAQLRWLYEHCAAYIFPSLSEGFGLPGLEAMRHGAPVVSSNATCLPEVYGDAAQYFNPLSVNDMANAIHVVITDESIRKDLITKGKEQVERYSWKRMAEQTLAVYEQVLGE